MYIFKYNKNIPACVAKADEIKSKCIHNLSILSSHDIKGKYVLIISLTERYTNEKALVKLDELMNKVHDITISINQSVNIIPPANIIELPAIPEGVLKPHVNIFVNFYITPSSERNDEILATFYKNVNDDTIDNIYIIRTKSECHNIQSDKIVDIITDERPKYITWFNYINKYTNPDDVNVIINSDCFFNSNFKYLVHHIKHNECYLLNRLEVIDLNDLSKSIRMVGPIDSQDAWAFKGAVHVEGGDYFMGKPGCDNKICYDINNSSYDIISPLKSNVFVYHYHNDSYRSHVDGIDRLSRPYAFPRESYINVKSEILISD